MKYQNTNMSVKELSKDEQKLLVKLLIRMYKTTEDTIIKSHAKGIYIKLLMENE